MAAHKIKITFTPTLGTPKLVLDDGDCQMQNIGGSAVYENLQFEVIGNYIVLSIYPVGTSGTECSLIVEVDGKTQTYKGSFSIDGTGDVADNIPVPMIVDAKDKTIPYPK